MDDRMDREAAGRQATDRALLGLGGADARSFLQGLVTNDMRRLEAGPVYAALLSPQGKYLFDFFIGLDPADPARLLLDVAADRAEALARRLGMYRLRADVAIAPDPRGVVTGTGPAPAGAFADPRDPRLGWRLWTDDAAGVLAGLAPLDAEAALRRRIALGVPEAGSELVPDESYILEMGFERLHGVDFRKGCYVGQEVTARMKHKTELRKGLVRVRVTGTPPESGTEITGGGRSAGVLGAVADGRGLAWLRFDRAGGPLLAGAAELVVEPGDLPGAG